MPAAAAEWTERREQAVKLVWEDRLSDEEIAAQLGIHRKTLWRWKTHPEFQGRIAALMAAMDREYRREMHAEIARRFS